MKDWLRKVSRKQLYISLGIVILALGLMIYTYCSATAVLPQSTVELLPDVKLPTKGQTVIVFSPHPDDETLGAGGFIAESESRGANVFVVLVTDGNKHGLKDERYAEFRNSTSILGVPSDHLVFLNYADGSLNKIDLTKLDNDLKKEIDQINPQIVLTTAPQDEHPDHKAVGVEVQKILKSEKKNITLYQYLIHYTMFPQPRKYDTADYLTPPTKLTTFDSNWQKQMLSSDSEQRKNSAVFSYKSQLKTPILKSLMLSLVRKNEIFQLGDSQ